jgi:hypothetical protein
MKKATNNNYTKVGKPLCQKEFEQMIKRAESGPFYSMQTVKAEFEKWKAKYSKL